MNKTVVVCWDKYDEVLVYVLEGGGASYRRGAVASLERSGLRHVRAYKLISEPPTQGPFVVAAEGDEAYIGRYNTTGWDVVARMDRWWP